jgi:23S rRNA (uracil1939-C5)-methyltransferase
MLLEVRIERLGARGDGIASGPDGPLYVPFTLPGELASIDVEPGRDQARLLEVLQPSPERAVPVCPNFGVCGGCSLQHIEREAYLSWKREQVVAALRSHGLDVPVEPVRSLPLASRRRATFALGRAGPKPVFGYRGARSHVIVPIYVCPVLWPRIEASLPGLRTALTPLIGRREARITVTETLTGLDLAMEGGKLPPHFVPQLATALADLGAARLTLDGETALLLAEPLVAFSGVKVRLPPGAFLQASQEAETVMCALALAGIGKSRRVADLFAGLGTFTFALAAGAAIEAFEADDDAIASLAQAARTTSGLKPIRAQIRDLFRAPLTAKELGAYDAVLLDPPRAGAEAQSKALAASRVPRIVMVSCNPSSCARDLRILVDGGYRIETITPIDQFLFSAHTELMAVLER